jgi:hypothetical protein
LVPNTIAPESVICLLRGNVGWIGFIEVVIDHLPGAAKVPAIQGGRGKSQSTGSDLASRGDGKN